MTWTLTLDGHWGTGLWESLLNHAADRGRQFWMGEMKKKTCWYWIIVQENIFLIACYCITWVISTYYVGVFLVMNIEINVTELKLNWIDTILPFTFLGKSQCGFCVDHNTMHVELKVYGRQWANIHVCCTLYCVIFTIHQEKYRLKDIFPPVFSHFRVNFLCTFHMFQLCAASWIFHKYVMKQNAIFSSFQG